VIRAQGLRNGADRTAFVSPIDGERAPRERAEVRQEPETVRNDQRRLSLGSGVSRDAFFAVGIAVELAQ
jgi:hypothetical protein